MYVHTLSAKNFRNYSNVNIELSSGFNFITGPNGAGKTNILEALSVLSNLRSFRGVLDTDIVKWGESSYYLNCQVKDSDNSLFEVGFSIEEKKLKKRARIDGSIIHRSSEYFGRLKTVIFSPADINMIDGPPDLRRRFFDTMLSQTDETYINLLSDFKKVLASRNMLLRQIQSNRMSSKGDLDPWDQMYARISFDIVRKRTIAVAGFTTVFIGAYSSVIDDTGIPVIEYKSNFHSITESDILEKIKRNRDRDIASGITGEGPQRDDFLLMWNNTYFSSSASQGQKRIAVISLRNAEKSYIEETTGKTTVIMVDDVFSELDAKRRMNLIESLKGKNQVIMTMVDSSKIKWCVDRCCNFEIDGPGCIVNT